MRIIIWKSKIVILQFFYKTLRHIFHQIHWDFKIIKIVLV